MNTIYRGFDATINFFAKDSNGDAVDLSAKTDIKACLGSQTYTDTVELNLISGPLGHWRLIIPAASTTSLSLGKDTVEGQVELGTNVNPIEFRAQVNVKDKPCP